MKSTDVKQSTLLRRAFRIFVSVTIGLALLAGGIWVLTQTVGDRVALYAGKSLYEWSEQIKGRDTTASNHASLVLNREIIPRLTKTMFEDTRDSSLRMALVDKLNTLPGVNVFAQVAYSRRAEAAAGFGEFGPAAEAAGPALLQALQGRDPAVRGPAAVSLGKIHWKPDVVIPLLIKGLEDDDLREPAAEALGELGSLSKAAVPKLLLLFRVPDKDLHHAVAEALKKIDPEAAAQAGVRVEARPAALPNTGAR
ncbi:MAG TPA: HEAT repeat domain-containing protein [Verrucomicrobiae bacterium]|nr:HEAT repeat domain-containing protein [Verrucomicrobiae bacterium]